jgi:outer membrane protein OmpA-like peptidoglycan-associated protein
MIKHIFLILIFAVGVTSCKAQTPLTTKSKKAEKSYNLAIQYMDTFQWDKALAELKKAKEADPNFVEAYTLQANLHLQLREWDKAEAEFEQAFKINPTFFPGSFYDCANAEMKQGKYAEAKVHYEEYKKTRRSGTPQRLVDDTERQIANCDFALKAIANPVPFKPVNMGTSMNSDECEYFPNVTADDNTFLFTRNALTKNPNGVGQRSQEDFYISYKGDDGAWSKATALSSINTPTNEGAPSLSADGRYLYFAACEEMDGYGGGRMGYGSCDIFFTQKVNGQWTRAVNVGTPVNTAAWETQPSFSSDGRTLYYISNRRDGLGNSDIWMCMLNDSGKWGKPVNLGKDINTTGKEEAVFIHPDNQTLYFASDGHTGMGGLDLYMCRRDSLGNWGKPVNLGYPINTFADESGLIVNGQGNLAYFSSTREGTNGCDDIYYFEIPKPLQPVAVTYMKGKVYDIKTKAPLGASFDLIDLATGKTIVSSNSDPVTGEFLVCIPQNKNYALNVNRGGYLPYSESFWMVESTNPGQPYYMDVPLTPVEVNAPTVLKNVYFDIDKWDLKPTSTAELDRMVTWLKANPNIKGEVGGHTDNTGDKKHNQELSQKRAKSVYDYLVSHGIDATRLTYKGYGDTSPLVPNDTPEHKQMNRRTEFKITSLK